MFDLATSNWSLMKMLVLLQKLLTWAQNEIKVAKRNDS